MPESGSNRPSSALSTASRPSAITTLELPWRAGPPFRLLGPHGRPRPAEQAPSPLRERDAPSSTPLPCRPQRRAVHPFPDERTSTPAAAILLADACIAGASTLPDRRDGPRQETMPDTDRIVRLDLPEAGRQATGPSAQSAETIGVAVSSRVVAPPLALGRASGSGRPLTVRALVGVQVRPSEIPDHEKARGHEGRPDHPARVCRHSGPRSRPGRRWYRDGRAVGRTLPKRDDLVPRGLHESGSSPYATGLRGCRNTRFERATLCRSRDRRS